MTNEVRAILVHLACQPTTGEVVAKERDYQPDTATEDEQDKFFDAWNARLDQFDGQTTYDDGQMDGQIMLARKLCQYAGIAYQVYTGHVELYDPITYDPAKGS